MDWGVDDSAQPRSNRPFYDKLAGDKNLSVVLVNLTNTVEGMSAIHF